MKIKNRALAFIILLIVLNCNFVFAAQNNINPAVTKAKLVKDYSETTKFNWMDRVWIGLYPQKSADGSGVRPLEWLVLDKQGDKALLISKYIIDKIPYSLTEENCNWETSFIRQWLNSEFYNNVFDAEDKNYILPTTNLTTDKRTNTTITTIDNVFLLSDDEVIKYFNLTKKDGINGYYSYEASPKLESSYTEFAELRGKTYSNEYCDYFLRTLRTEDHLFVDTVSVDKGQENNHSYTTIYPDFGGITVKESSGIRPAMWVKFDPNAKGDIPDIVGIADDLGITNDVIKEGVKMGTDLIPMPKPIGIIKDKAIDAVGDKIIDALRGK